MNSNAKFLTVAAAVLVLGVALNYEPAQRKAAADTNKIQAVVSAEAAYFGFADETEPEPMACNCNGTGRTGDGLSVCQCGPNCDCKATGQSGAAKAKGPPPYHAEFWTASWCGPCKQTLAEVLPWLQKSDWKDGRNYFVKDSDALAAEAQRKNIKALPTVIIYEGDTEVGRHVGRMSKRQFTALLGDLPTKHAKPQAFGATPQEMDAMFAGAMPPKDVSDKLTTLLTTGRLELSNGIAVTAETPLRATVHGSRTGVTTVEFQSKLRTDITRLMGMISIRKLITSVRIEKAKAFIYLDNENTPAAEIDLK